MKEDEELFQEIEEKVIKELDINIEEYSDIEVEWFIKEEGIALFSYQDRDYHVLYSVNSNRIIYECEVYNQVWVDDLEVAKVIYVTYDGFLVDCIDLTGKSFFKNWHQTAFINEKLNEDLYLVSGRSLFQRNFDDVKGSYIHEDKMTNEELENERYRMESYRGFRNLAIVDLDEYSYNIHSRKGDNFWEDLIVAPKKIAHVERSLSGNLVEINFDIEFCMSCRATRERTCNCDKSRVTFGEHNIDVIYNLKDNCWEFAAGLLKNT